jgi:hypothetical protein
MIDSLPVIALAQLLSNQSRHHTPDPLFPNDCILCLLQAGRIVVIDTIEGRRDFGFLCEESFGFGSRSHDEEWQVYSRVFGGRGRAIEVERWARLVSFET